MQSSEDSASGASLYKWLAEVINTAVESRRNVRVSSFSDLSVTIY